MSFNANTIYKAVDVDQLAKECKDAITQDDVFVVTDWFGGVHSVHRFVTGAKAEAEELNKGDPDGYWVVEEYGLR
jgi:hypothetical protein